MTLSEREQALQEEMYLLNQMQHVLGTFVQRSSSTGPTTVMGSPATIPGTPKALIGIPAALGGPGGAPPSSSQLLAHDVEEMLLHETELAKGHPNEDDITILLVSILSTVTSMRQIAVLLSTEELQSLMAGVTGVVGQMSGVMEAFVK